MNKEKGIVVEYSENLSGIMDRSTNGYRNSMYRKLSEFYNENGISTFRMGVLDEKHPIKDYSNATLTLRKERVLNATKYCIKEYKPDKLDVFGYSFGALAVLFAALEYPYSHITISSTPLQKNERIFKKLPESYRTDLEKYNIEQLRELKTPTFIIHGEKDGTAPLEGAEKLYNMLLPNAELYKMKDANHTLGALFDNSCITLAVKNSLNWFEGNGHSSMMSNNHGNMSNNRNII